MVINSPASAAKVCQAGAAAFGPQVTATGISATWSSRRRRRLVPGPPPAPSPSTSDACTPLVNEAAIAGKIALVDRGVCGFAIKVKNAQNAGAIGVVVGNNVDVVRGWPAPTRPSPSRR